MRHALLLLGLLVASTAGAGEATVSWVNAPGIAASELAIGSCIDATHYGQDVADANGKVEYTRIPADRNDALLARLGQGETFCFRLRHISPAGVPSAWLFLGSKKIPLDSVAQPPTLPPAPAPTNGSVK